MFTFFWRHKILTLLIGCVVAYIALNPSGKFGYAQKNLVIFNRIPVFFFDLSIAPDGKPRWKENIGAKKALDDLMFDFFLTTSPEGTLLIVGTGFERNSFVLSDDMAISLEGKGVKLKQLPSRDAIKLYNYSVDQNSKVALLLCIKK